MSDWTITTFWPFAIVFSACSSEAPRTMLVCWTAVPTFTGFTAAAVSAVAESAADPLDVRETCVFRIFAICAMPAAVTAAAWIAPTMMPAGGGMEATACMYAPIAPEIVSIVAEAIRRAFACFAAFSLASLSCS